MFSKRKLKYFGEKIFGCLYFLFPKLKINHVKDDFSVKVYASHTVFFYSAVCISYMSIIAKLFCTTHLLVAFNMTGLNLNAIVSLGSVRGMWK